MNKLNIPKDIRRYILKRKIIYSIFFVLIISLVAFICVSGEYVSTLGTVLALIVTFVILAGLPVFKNNLFDKSWYGEIIKIHDLNVTVPGKGVIGTYLAFKRYSTFTANFLMITLKNGDEVFDKTIRMPKNFPVNSLTEIYTNGTRILHIGGTSQHVVFKEHSDSYICPICGIDNPAENTNCHDCGHTLIKDL